MTQGTHYKDTKNPLRQLNWLLKSGLWLLCGPGVLQCIQNISSLKPQREILSIYKHVCTISPVLIVNLFGILSHLKTLIEPYNSSACILLGRVLCLFYASMNSCTRMSKLAGLVLHLQLYFYIMIFQLLLLLK